MITHSCFPQEMARRTPSYSTSANTAARGNMTKPTRWWSRSSRVHRCCPCPSPSWCRRTRLCPVLRRAAEPCSSRLSPRTRFRRSNRWGRTCLPRLTSPRGSPNSRRSSWTSRSASCPTRTTRRPSSWHCRRPSRPTRSRSTRERPTLRRWRAPPNRGWTWPRHNVGRDRHWPGRGRDRFGME